MLPIPATDEVRILSLSQSLGPLSTGMAFLPSVSISVSAGSPKPNWMHLIQLTPTYPRSRQERWTCGRRAQPMANSCVILGHSPEVAGSWLVQPFAIYRADFHLN